MDRYAIMMPRLLPAEGSKPRLYQPLLVTAGIILTCCGNNPHLLWSANGGVVPAAHPA
jgi:hypothetical protein